MYISNGIDVDAGWKDSLAWSDNGTKWNSIKFDGITVEYRKRQKRSGALNHSSGHNYSIQLSDEGKDKLRFTLPIANQAGWTNDIAGAQQAVDDITTWMSVSVDHEDIMIQVLQQIENNTDEIETILYAIEGNTDEIEGILTQIENNTDQLEGQLDTLIAEVDNKGTTTPISVPLSTSSVSLVPAQVNRVEAIITNNSSVDMWISFGSAAAVDKGTVLRKKSIMIVDRTDEEIFGIWVSASVGSAVIQHIF